MSCQINTIAQIHDIPTIRRCLFPMDDLRGSDSWLQLCAVSASPTGETIAIANEKRLVVLVAKWDSINLINRFEVLFSGSVDGDDPIKAVLCLPIVVQSHSSQGGPEWNCIAIGFESGFVRFYTEDCKLLLSEQFHTENVCDIKCQSQHSPRPDISVKLKPEELYVRYPSCVCNISGNQLFNILRNCRSELLRGSGIYCDTTLASTNIKKWAFTEQFLINDIAMVGLDLANTFDHLLTASTCGGFDTRYRAMPPHNNLVIAAGSKPFIGYHYALEGGVQPILTDVAKAVASKLKSALPGWLTGNKANVDKQMALAIQPAEAMGCRFGICDLQRMAVSVLLSQDRTLAAVTDSLGRVFLLDSYKGTVIRLFKGFREAQCAFIQVPDEKRSKHRSNTRIATFLIIYTPRKGIVEIFTAQQGLKIATFSASKFSVLLYICYGLVGFNVMSKSRYICQFTCILIDSDGLIKEVAIPFHYAETENNSKRARDLHLYKLLKQYIRSTTCTDNFVDETLNTLSEIKTSEVHLQCLQMLTNCKEITPEVIIKSTEYILDKYREDMDNDSKTLRNLSEKLSLLACLYLYLSTLDLDSENGNNLMSCSDNNCDTKLSVGDNVLGNLQKLLDLSTLNNKTSNQHRVAFCEDTAFGFSDYLNTFDISRNCICLKPNVEAVLFRISELFFKRYVVVGGCDFDQLHSELVKSGIASCDLFKMLLHYWVNRDLHINVNLEQEMHNTSRIIYIICKIEGISSDITAEYNKTSQFWSDIRDILGKSPRPFPALTAALICRSIAQKIECEKELQHSGTSLDEDNIEIWEKLSHENCEWMLLIGKLEDVSLLNIILSNKPCISNYDTCTLRKLKHEPVVISLQYILEKGRGIVSELVAQWLTTSGIQPHILISEDLNVIEHLYLIKKQFPYSLDASVILANMCWEYAIAWQKNLQEFLYLEAAIKCLNCIPQAHIRQGLYNLVWNTHLKIIFESACKLINKVGKLPKETLCKQDTDLTDLQIELFIRISTQFLDDFLAVVQESYNCAKIQIKYENIWENGGHPLAELALQQNNINYDLLHAHYQLSLAIEMITTFKIRHTKPVSNLFDSAVISVFFTDLQQKTGVSWHRSDTKIHASRTQFLLKIITASLETVTTNDNNLYSVTHVIWMGKCLSLARVWNLDVDLLKRFQVTQLFLNGFDNIAEELLPGLTETGKLGPDILSIAGKRLRQLLASSGDFSEKITALSPSLTKYIESLNEDWCAPSSLESILSITTHCVQYLKETQLEYKIACQLLEACSTLMDIQR